MKFIRLKEQNGTLFLNLENIIGIHRERGIVYVANSAGQDVFMLDKESMDRLVTALYQEADIYDI